MATYNGEKYIGEQLQSLASQTYPPDELVVGDDGSSDRTVKIIEEFRNYAPFPVHIHANKNNLGYARNFLATAKRCQGDWVAFCDQDDVWLPDKLAKTVDAIRHTPSCKMVLQNAWLCDKALISRGRKFPNRLKTGIHDCGRQYGFWVWPGFLKTVSKEMIDLLSDEQLPRSWFPKEGELTHDKWTCVIANALGDTVILGDPAALYRRHEETVTGNYNRQSLGERVVKSRSVLGNHYVFLAEIAEECGCYMKRLAEHTDKPAWASAFRENAKQFCRLSEIQCLRGRLYAGPPFRERLTACLQIAGKGGYIGQPFHAMGMRSAVKDIIRVVAGSRL
jgi:glycosyltransferase involved in cell wall biosynthesis